MNPVTAEVDGGRIAVDCQYNDKENVKQVPGARWDARERRWTVPLSWAAMLQLRGVFGNRLQIGEQLVGLGRKVRDLRVRPAMELRAAEDAEGHPDLAPLQRAGAKFMAVSVPALNTDPQGSGKTPQTVAALEELYHSGRDPFPCLIVCPNSVKAHWEDEIPMWWREGEPPSVAVLQGNVKKRREVLEQGADIVVMNWELLHRHSRLTGFGNMSLSEKEKEPKELNEVEWRTVVADEVHRAKEPRAKQTRALWWIGDRAKFRFGLSGTPVANSPADLWSVMRFVAPDEYPSKTAWLERYGLLSWNAFGGMDVVGIRGDTREELFGFLDPRLIRRPKEVILPQLRGKLPPKVRRVELPPKQRKAYNSLREEMYAELEGGTLMAKNPMTRVGRLRQLAGATGMIDEDGEVQLTDPSAKVDELVDILQDLGPDDQAIVFAESRKLLELAAARLEKVGLTHGLFTGKVDAQSREVQRKMFQDGNLPVLLLTYGAGAEGINLSMATVQVRLERSWSAVKDSQALERADRFGGRSEPIRVIDVVAEDTVDSRVHETLLEKGRMLQEVVRDEEVLREWLKK